MKTLAPGERFGRWTVVERDYSRRGRGLWYVFKCDCGTVKTVHASTVRTGQSRSCGCLKSELDSARLTTHGQTGSAEYRAWLDIIKRCGNPKSKSYRDYGARGIRLCPEWRQSFQAFIGHVGKRPSNEHSIERIDNSRGYEPGNVVWATPAQQMRNTRRNRYVLVNSRKLALVDAAKVFRIAYPSLCWRLQNGWSVVDSLAAPVRLR